ncbi:MAG TPA: hypothetical protein VFV92_04730 [Candidatus Bathyarchaeia archaeon]|nr:hypothetical protein [Candidatus Bathyarchaeia archaeon]
MLYNVRARPRTTELQRFWTLLTDGTIGSQEPDGLEIIASMKRAVLNWDMVHWSETCFCNPPLKHERTTVYDQFFSDIEVQPKTGPEKLRGEQFWRYLQETFGETPTTDGAGYLTTGLRHVPLRIL